MLADTSDIAQEMQIHHFLTEEIIQIKMSTSWDVMYCA